MPATTRRCATQKELALLMVALLRYRGPQLPDGLVRKHNAHPTHFNANQLARGVLVEMEHTSRPEIALEIAMAHLLERPDYYARLLRAHL